MSALSLRRRLLGGAKTIFAIHLFWIGASMLAASGLPNLRLEIETLTRPSYPVFFGFLATTFVAWTLLSVPLRLVWLAALEEPRSPVSAIARGAQRTMRALLFHAIDLGLLLLLLVATGVVIWVLDAALEGPDSRAHDIALLVGASPLALYLVIRGAAIDLASARLLNAGVFEALKEARGAWKAAFEYAAFALCGLFALGAAIELEKYAWGFLPIHVLLLLRTLLRSAWLSLALNRVSKS